MQTQRPTWAKRVIDRVGPVTAWLFLLGIIYISLTSSIIYSGMDAIERSHAEVNAREGMLIFTDCKPLKSYDVVGNVKIGFAVAGEYSEIIDKLAKKAHKDYPTAHGIIFDGNNKAQVVQFK